MRFSTQENAVVVLDAQAVQSLVARARQGDREALSQLLRYYEQRLLSAVRAELGERLRERLESQDVLQQVYLDALGCIDQFVDRGADSFFAWLHRIALNRICDIDRCYFQTAKRGGERRGADLHQEDAMSRLFSSLTASRASPSTAADSTSRQRLLRQALDSLREDQRQAIELRYLQQLNVTQTAAKMGRSEGAVRSLCVRGLVRLRELLGDAV